MIVMKFGGTSVEDSQCIERVAGIVRSRLASRPIVVVSAMGKTTRRLLEAAKSSAAGDSHTTLAIIDGLERRHGEEARRVITTPNAPEFLLIQHYFEDLKKLLEGLAILSEVPPRGLDKILSYGELLSSAILARALSERGVPARLLDAREIIKTNDRYGAATPACEVTYERARQAILPVLNEGATPVLQGFIGSTSFGATTTLGFEGSDYTAALVGSAVDADDIQIWKDVSGLMTADPKVLSSARTVTACSYSEAAELTYFGAKVLHQKAIYPAAQKNIPVHIYNSKDSSATGTEISSRAGLTSTPAVSPVVSIAYKMPVSIISGEATRGVGGDAALGSLLNRLLAAAAGHQLDPMIAAGSPSSAMIVLDSSALAGESAQSLVEEIAAIGTVEMGHGYGIVTLVGDGLGRDPGLPSHAFQALDGIPIRTTLQGASGKTLSIVVDETSVVEAIARLHRRFFQTVDPRVSG
ncbi:MAG TPA: aspartate kinase [Blastocatellia bacterium]|nr:aspartate kinase [Blastocatellia bacterium]